eukprot:1383050-Amphidinium_carterae.1
MIRKEKTLESVNVGIAPLAPQVPQNNKKQILFLLLARLFGLCSEQSTTSRGVLAEDNDTHGGQPWSSARRPCSAKQHERMTSK